LGTISRTSSKPLNDHSKKKIEDTADYLERSEKQRRKMETCMDDKWKLSKKGSRRSGTVAPAAATSSPVGLKGRTARGSGRSVPGRLASLAKEQRARFYIMRRCVTMLVCWRD
jgi:hypothetical protein